MKTCKDCGFTSVSGTVHEVSCTTVSGTTLLPSVSKEDQYTAAKKALDVCFLSYQNWQTNSRDKETFLDWIKDELEIK